MEQESEGLLAVHSLQQKVFYTPQEKYSTVLKSTGKISMRPSYSSRECTQLSFQHYFYEQAQVLILAFPKFRFFIVLEFWNGQLWTCAMISFVIWEKYVPCLMKWAKPNTLIYFWSRYRAKVICCSCTGGLYIGCIWIMFWHFRNCLSFQTPGFPSSVSLFKTGTAYLSWPWG